MMSIAACMRVLTPAPCCRLGFIDYVVRPLYLTLAIVAPGLGPRCLAAIESNRSAWAEIITLSDSETASSRRSG